MNEHTFMSNTPLSFCENQQCHPGERPVTPQDSPALDVAGDVESSTESKIPLSLKGHH